MPANKNAMTRYALIDKMLANRHRALSIQDITDLLNAKLDEHGYDPVSKRCIEKDIAYLQNGSPFLVDIEEFWVDAADRNGRPYRKRCIRYSDATFSIFKPKLTEDEKAVLSAALDTLGSFEGLENFEWLNDIKLRLNLEERSTPVIWVSKNLLSNSTLIARLFSAIRSNQVLTLSYFKFDDSTIRTTDIIPRILKEYNNRWFLIASACDSEKILTFPLDRIEDFDENHVIAYKALSKDIREQYEDIIGVTNIEGAPIEEIIFWVSNSSKDYVLTKPLHDSQVRFGKTSELVLRKNYPHFVGGEFFKIQCKKNFELIRELCSFGSDLIVLSPKSIVEDITNRISAMAARYAQ